MVTNEDCFKYLETFGKRIDLVVSDPPYGISFDATAHMESSDWDKLSREEYVSFITKYLSLCREKLADNGSVWLFFAPSMVNELFEAAEKSGLYLHLDCWKSFCRQKGRGAKSKLKSLREDFILMTKDKDDFVRNDVDNILSYKETATNILNSYTGDVERPHVKLDDTIWCFKMPYYLSKTEKQIHSCQKSILMLYTLIMRSSNENGVVFDGFAGSGSCAIAAKLAGRDFYGCELDKEMCSKANKWISSFDYSSYERSFLSNGSKSWFGRY